MKLPCIILVILCFTLGCSLQPDDFSEKSTSERFDFSPETCAISEIAATPLHEQHLRFARLLAISLGQSEALRRVIKNASEAPGQPYFNEILVNDLLPETVENTNVEARLRQTFESNSSLAEGQTFQTFKNDLLTADPLLVIKIPDWLFDTIWNTQITAPDVVSNRLGQEQLLYGFDKNGNCFSKESYVEFSNYEIVVKTSEDYLWIENQNFLSGFANPCVSYNDFFQTYARSYAGHYLLKKRDFQKLFLSCLPDGPDGPVNPPPSSCLRDAGFDHNYMLGFQLANTGLWQTLQNQPCLGGEETFDFQIDFLYAARTEEAMAIDLKLPPLPLYGVRAVELVDYKIVKKPGPWILHTYGVETTPRYFAINLGNVQQKFNYMAQISPNQPEWLSDVFGQAIYVTWNETDFEICTASGVTTTTNATGLTLNLGLKFDWIGKDQNANAAFNTSYSKVSQHTVNVSGASVIPLGYNALGYCNPPTPGIPPSVWYPTGPQGLLVHFNYVVE